MFDHIIEPFRQEVMATVNLPGLRCEGKKDMLRIRYTHPGLNPEKLYLALDVTYAVNNAIIYSLTNNFEIFVLCEENNHISAQHAASVFTTGISKYPCVGERHHRYLDIVLDSIRSKDIFLSLLPRMLLCSDEECRWQTSEKIQWKAERVGMTHEEFNRIKEACNVAHQIR